MNKNRLIRILQVGMSPYYGGTEAFLMSQYRVIDKTKIQFDFLNVYKEKIACQDEIVNMGGRIYYLDMARHRGVKRYYQNIDTFFKKNANQFDIVHCNYQSLINTDILKYAKKNGIKVRIAHAHNSGYGVEPSNRQKFLIFLNRITIKRYATNFFACSSLAAEWMFKTKATIIKNAIDVDKYIFSSQEREKVRRQLEFNDQEIILFVGRLDPQKNPLFLIDIFREIKVKKQDSMLVIVGEGYLKDEITAKIVEYKLENDVKILGTRNDVNELLQAADIFVLPSRFEGLGIALVESQAAGLPTFTTKDVVPDDVKITDLLEFVPVNASAKEWATRILCADTMTRKNMGNQVRMAGYDNYENAKNLESLYLSFFNSK